MEQKRYGLGTAIAMIIGTVIGSGIFFKSDNVLVATGKNVWLGVLAFCIAAFAISFGCITISELAKRSEGSGGVISYADKFCGQHIASSFGWFFALVYYPALCVVVSWVVGIYACMLFGIQGKLDIQMLIGFIFLGLCILYNIYWPRFAGYFQQFSTVAKLIPLAVVGAIGLIFGNPEHLKVAGMDQATSNLGWISAVAPIAFAFDGWIVATAISSELKNAKKNLPLAMLISPLFILIAYLIYFVGISKLVGVEQITSLGDQHVNIAMSALIGNWGTKVLLTFIIISVMGTVNGVSVAGVRAPYALAERGLFPFSSKLVTKHAKTDMPLISGLAFFIICSAWYIMHYFTVKYNWLPNSDISEIAIVVQYLLYLVLYYKVIKLFQQKEIQTWTKGLLFPVFAILGSLIMLYGGLQNPLAPYYVLFCIVVLIMGYAFSKIKQSIKL